jgi:hypothetical protein
LFEVKGFDANSRTAGSAEVTRIQEDLYRFDITGTFASREIQELINAIVALQD